MCADFNTKQGLVGGALPRYTACIFSDGLRYLHLLGHYSHFIRKPDFEPTLPRDEM